MTPTNLEIVRLIQEGTAAGDMAVGAQFYGPDFTLREAPSLPYGGTYSGEAALGDFIRRHHETWSEHRFEVKKYIDAGDQVICLVELTGRSRATGREVSMSVTEWWTLKDGRVVEIHEFYFDTAAVLAAITPDASAPKASS